MNKPDTPAKTIQEFSAKNDERTEDFNMMFLNIRSLSRKLDELELQIEGKRFDAILLCKDWLTESAMESCRLPN